MNKSGTFKNKKTIFNVLALSHVLTINGIEVDAMVSELWE